MTRRPGTAELLEAARQALIEEVVPQLSGDSKYAALMVASSMATALRDLDAGGAAEDEELALFTALYGKDAIAAAGPGPEEALPALNRRFSEELRAGRWDAMPPAARNLLMEKACLRLARSNPKYLAGLEAKQGSKGKG